MLQWLYPTWNRSPWELLLKRVWLCLQGLLKDLLHFKSISKYTCLFIFFPFISMIRSESTPFQIEPHSQKHHAYYNTLAHSKLKLKITKRIYLPYHTIVHNFINNFFLKIVQTLHEYFSFSNFFLFLWCFFITRNMVWRLHSGLSRINCPVNSLGAFSNTWFVIGRTNGANSRWIRIVQWRHRAIHFVQYYFSCLD